MLCQAQYVFIHDTLRELLLCGETEIQAPNLGIVINKLSGTRDGSRGFERQFKVNLYIARLLKLRLT